MSSGLARWLGQSRQREKADDCRHDQLCSEREVVEHASQGGKRRDFRVPRSAPWHQQDGEAAAHHA